MNLNFNQCNGFNYPIPIFSTRLELLQQLISSPNTVVNPPLPISWAYFNFTIPQTVPANGVVSFNLIAGSTGEQSNIGNISLNSGTYQISYSVSAIIPSNGTASVALYQDNVIVPTSEASSTGTIGSTATLANSAIITVPVDGGVVSLRNNNSVSETFNFGNLTISRIN